VFCRKMARFMLLLFVFALAAPDEWILLENHDGDTSVHKNCSHCPDSQPDGGGCGDNCQCLCCVGHAPSFVAQSTLGLSSALLVGAPVLARMVNRPLQDIVRLIYHPPRTSR